MGISPAKNILVDVKFSEAAKCTYHVEKRYGWCSQSSWLDIKSMYLVLLTHNHSYAVLVGNLLGFDKSIWVTLIKEIETKFRWKHMGTHGELIC